MRFFLASMLPNTLHLLRTKTLMWLLAFACDDDLQYVKDILRRIGVRNDPENVTRLGNPDEKRRRTIKVEMKTAKDKDNVLSNLRKLKGTEEEFGKISITSDYTKSERDQIRAMSEKAKAQTESSEDRVFKVRGDPKNGLKIVSFPKK